jgi:hypothetical protein
MLLLAGVRIGRAVIGTLFGAVGLGAGLVLAAEISVLLAAAIAVLVVGAGMAVYLRLPRLVMAAANLWPLPMVYVAHLLFTGSFHRSVPVMIVLAGVGAVAGLAMPRASLALQAAGIGTILLVVAGPLEPGFGLGLGVACGSLAWQLGVVRLPRTTPQQSEGGSVRGAEGGFGRWFEVVKRAAAAMTLGLVLVAFTAPSYDLGRVEDPGRLQVLADGGDLGRPGLVLTPASNLYLSGRPVAPAIVCREVGLGARLQFLLTGRTLERTVRRMRAVKDARELEALRTAADITSRAFADLEPLIRPGATEADIERRILRSFAEHRATGVSFRPIVGSGSNAVLPHYDRNEDVMQDGMVVIDIGCSYHGYAGDMTRTYSVTGEYSEAQRLLIETVLAAGDAARAALGPGASMREVDAAARRVIEDAGFGDHFRHFIGHHVGLDVHDPGRSPLAPGMVVTIEPGIYVPEGASTDPAYWGLGVRIEDTYVITENGWEEITHHPRRPYAEPPEDSDIQPSESS